MQKGLQNKCTDLFTTNQVVYLAETISISKTKGE